MRGIVQSMDNTLVRRYSELQAAADDIKIKKAQAEARLEDAREKLEKGVAEVKSLGFQTVAELQLAIAAADGELKVQLEKAEAKLAQGGYA